MADIRRRSRRARINVRNRLQINSYRSLEIVQRFSFSLEFIQYLTGILSDRLTTETKRNRRILPLLQVRETLRFLETVSILRVVGESIGVSESVKRFVRHPTEEKQRQVAEDFYNKSGE
ncbi:hypothetical protein DPMN_087963 [Dreissena polymorpha]|uniref:Uncharacterized protein n=1 Tax=Dreissena polymorpha TaxID=45954 RepID=A0A9D4KV08_DREPO|nr:hypothetical protein DPMN_087963 [Dreissena polymorpha]